LGDRGQIKPSRPAPSHWFHPVAFFMMKNKYRNMKNHGDHGDLDFSQSIIEFCIVVYRC
jgi:hypothetical protein